MEVRTDERSLENWSTKDLKTVGVPSPRQARWNHLFSKLDLHVVYTQGPVNPVLGGSSCMVKNEGKGRKMTGFQRHQRMVVLMDILRPSQTSMAE